MTLLVLSVVTVVGLEVNGTRGWLAMGGFRVQPSEPAKVVLIIGLALLLSPSRQGVVSLQQMLIGLGAAAAPIALVLSQPRSRHCPGVSDRGFRDDSGERDRR